MLQALREQQALDAVLPADPGGCGLSRSANVHSNGAIVNMESVQPPEAVSYDLLLQKLFNRSLSGLSDEQLAYFLELVQRLRELKERTDTEAWWFRYYR